MRTASLIMGILGTLCLAGSFQCRQEKQLFLLQMSSGVFFVLHYGLAGDYTGMCMDFMCFLRSLMMASGKKALTGKKAMAALIVLIIALCVLTWDGIFSIFPTIALIGSTLALFTGKGTPIRITQFFCTSPAWMVYNVRVRSWPGVICESLDMGSVAVYYIRSRLRARKEKK